jgi:hypothetical protein
LVLHGGYEPRGLTEFDPDDTLATHAGYNVQRALVPAEVTAFVQATQPKPWAKLQAIHGVALGGIFLDALCKVIDQRGALAVIRQGFNFNRGHDRGAGNPSAEGKHRTCYLCEQVRQRDSLLDLVGRFIHL